MRNVPATVAALCIFNGLRISPVFTVPEAYRFTMPGSPVSPRFEQAERYLNRFFAPGYSLSDYMPLEVFSGVMAAAPWIRGTVGTLQWSLKEAHGITIPDAHDIDPSLWFEDLEGFAMMYNEHAKPAEAAQIKSLAAMVQTRWEEDTATAASPESNQYYIQKLYAQADAMRERDQLLTSAASIVRARVTLPLKPGQKYPF